MLFSAVIEVDIEDWLKDIDWYKNSLNFLYLSNNKNTVKTLVEIKGDEEAINKLNCYGVTKTFKNNYMCIINTNSKLLSILSNYIILNGFIMDGKEMWTIVLSDYRELRSLLRKINELGSKVKVTKVVKLKSESALTARQEQIIKYAIELGYYDFPRRITLKELAQRLNISPSNLAEILRRAEKNILEVYIRERIR
ncbi:MAG: helix-turn-helix domain-containing protein [Sulfolobaceae archaeon]|nr:helix-turn-helix domain-containing protein [Sulfolobaceae archaeon]